MIENNFMRAKLMLPLEYKGTVEDKVVNDN